MTIARLQTPSTLRQAAFEQLREDIVNGRLPPGAPLKDAELAAQLGLSPTPVREAMVELAGDGLIEIEPNRLKRVAPLDLQSVLELVEVQNAVWALGYQWGAPRVGPSELDRLRVIHAAHGRAIRKRDVGAAVVAALSFHRVVMDASRNRELVRITLDRLALIRRFVILCAPNLPSSQTHGYQMAILAALEAGDVEGAISNFHKVAAVLSAAARDARDEAEKHRETPQGELAEPLKRRKQR